MPGETARTVCISHDRNVPSNQSLTSAGGVFAERGQRGHFAPLDIALHWPLWWVQDFSGNQPSHCSCCRYWLLRLAGLWRLPILSKNSGPPTAILTPPQTSIEVSICAEEGHHGNHNCLHAQQFTPALNPILVFGKSPVFRTPPFVTENVRLFKVGIPRLRGPPLS